MRTRAFKLLFLVFVSLVTVLTLISCHGAKETVAFEMPETFDESREYEIVFWAKNENNATQRAVYEDAIARFEAIYPNISVTIKHYTDYGAIYNDVITNIATSTTPNVCITYPDHIATYISGENTVVPLNDLMNDAEYGFGGSLVKFDSPSADSLVSEFLDECYIGETLYGVPFMRSTEACYVNKTYVEALGYELPEVLTWDFVWEVSKAALKKDITFDEKGKMNEVYSVNGQKVMIPLIYKSTDNMMIQMLKQLDADYSTETGKIQIFNDTTKDVLYTVADQAAAGTFSTFKIEGYPGNYLNKGQCIFAIDSTAGSTWMGSDAPLMDVNASSVADFETVVMPIPQYDAEDPVMISQGPSLCIFNKEDPSEVVASWLFVQYLLSNETQIAYSQTEGYVPVTHSAQNDPEYLDYLSRAGENNDLYYDVKIAATKMLIDNIENTFTTPVFNGSTSLRNAAGEMIEKVTKSIQRREKVNDAYIEKLYSDMTSLYRLDQIETAFVKSRLGPLPTLSVVLLVTLGVVWVLIAAYVFIPKIKAKCRKKVENTPPRIDK